MIKRTQGFTLLELVVTLVIAGILAGIALPAFNNLINNSRLTATTNALVGAFNLARSEAVEANAPVIVEPNGTGGYQLRNVNTGDILRTFDGPSNTITLNPSGASVTYQPNGYRVFGSPVFTIEVCDPEANCRTVTVATGGAVSVASS